MPVITTPSGRRLRVPDDATQEQIMAVLQASGEMDSSAPPTPAAQPQGGLPGITSAQPAAQPQQREIIQPTQEELYPDPTAGMSTLGKIAAASGKSMVGMGRGARQLWNMATGDKEELARLEQEEAQARELDQPLMDTKAGKVGYYGTELGSFLLPATKVAKIPAIARAGRAGLAAGEAGLGAIQGALHPTIEGESKLENATVSAALGGVAPYVGPLLKGAKRAWAHVPALGKPTKDLILSAEKKASSEAARTAKEAAQIRNLAAQEANRNVRMAAQGAKAAEKAKAEALRQSQAEVRKRAGDVIEKHTGEKAGMMPVSPEVRKQLYSLSQAYKTELPDYFHQTATRLHAPGAVNVKVPVHVMQQLKSNLGNAARAAGAKREVNQPLHHAERKVVGAILDSMPKRKASLLRKAYEEYGTGVTSVPRRGVKPPPAPVAPAPVAPVSPTVGSRAAALRREAARAISENYGGMREAMPRQFFRQLFYPVFDERE